MASIQGRYQGSVPRILGLIGEGIQRNRSRFDGETVDRYVRRAIKIAEASRRTEYYSSSLIVLEKKFDHLLVSEYLRSNSPTEVQPLSSPESANKVASPPPTLALRKKRRPEGRRLPTYAGSALPRRERRRFHDHSRPWRSSRRRDGWWRTIEKENGRQILHNLEGRLPFPIPSELPAPFHRPSGYPHPSGAETCMDARPIPVLGIRSV